MKKTTILKFGGTSMGDEGTWRQVMEIITRYETPAVVVSATARTTRKLLEAAETAVTDLDGALSIKTEIEERHRSLVEKLLGRLSEWPDSNGEPPPGIAEADLPEHVLKHCKGWIATRMNNLETYLSGISINGSLEPQTRDAVAGIGEQLSSMLFALCARTGGLDTTWIDAREVIKTDSEFGRANPDMEQIRNTSSILREILENGSIPVIGGYYGEDARGRITTLGFEGSDFTASLLGAALEAESIEIWTDVSGIYTCDPRLIPDARPIGEMTFREATELAWFGAKVLHPATMKPASAADIPIRVKNIFEPDHPGTLIRHEARQEGPVRAITYMDGIDILTVTSSETLMGYRFLSRVFAILDEFRIPVDVVTTTEASVSVALEKDRNGEAVRARLGEIGEVSALTGQGLVSLIGCTFGDLESITDQVFGTLAKTGVSMISFSRTKRNLNLVLADKDLIPAVKAIHASLFS